MRSYDEQRGHRHSGHASQDVGPPARAFPPLFPLHASHFLGLGWPLGMHL